MFRTHRSGSRLRAALRRPGQGCRLPYIKGTMKTEMSSPEPSRSLVILQPRSLSTPRARITRSWAAIVYLRAELPFGLIPVSESGQRGRGESPNHAEESRNPHLCRSSGSQLDRKVLTDSATSSLVRTSQRPSVPITMTSSVPCSCCVRLYTFTCGNAERLCSVHVFE